MLMVAVILVVSGALIIGALWGLYGRLPSWLEGNLLALAGGALMISVVIELIQPAVTDSGVWVTAAFAMLGAVVFASVDYLLDEKLNADGGSGLLAAITLDDIPENLALGVALISGNVMQVAALAGSCYPTYQRQQVVPKKCAATVPAIKKCSCFGLGLQFYYRWRLS